MNPKALIDQARASGSSVARDVAAGVVALILAISGAGFLTAAGYGRLAREYGPDLAAAIIGAVLVALACAVVLYRQRARRAEQLRAELVALALAAQERPANPLNEAAFALAFSLGRYLRSSRK